MNPVLVWWFWCSIFLKPRAPSDKREVKDS
jgi:hypothetical protein